MRFFEVLGLQEVALFIFPTLIFIILFYFGLSYVRFQKRNSDEREKKVLHIYPGGIEARNSPFPLILIMIIIGFLLWAFFYTLGTGLLGVKI